MLIHSTKITKIFFITLSLMNLTIIFYFCQLNKKEYNQLICNNQSSNIIKKQDSYLNPHNYKFLINPEYEICKQELTIISFVFSAPSNFKKREQIRNTWGNVNRFKDFKLIFALALSNETNINEQIRQESLEYNDIIQEDYIDSYWNLTTKLVMCLKWSSIYCQNAKFLLRVNEDMVVNTQHLIEYLKILSKDKNNVKNTWYGYKIHTGPIRDSKHKFYISHEQLPADHYYPFMGGSAYILTNDLCGKYFYESLNKHIPPFSTWIEDIYVGMIAAKLRTRLVDIIEYFSYESQFWPEPLDKLIGNRNHEKLFFVFVRNDTQFDYAWKVLDPHNEKK